MDIYYKIGGNVSAILAAILASIPNALIAIGVRVFNENFMQEVLEKIISYGIHEAAAMTTNTVDDELARMVEDRLKALK